MPVCVQASCLGRQAGDPVLLRSCPISVPRIFLYAMCRPQDLPSLDPHHQYLLLELLLAQQAQQAAAAGSEPAPAPLSAAALLPMLRLLCATQHAEVRALAWRWGQARLEATGAFGPSAQGEAQVWLECLPR